MRIRSTKPEFWRSKTIAALPWDVRLVLKGIEAYVDDNGVGKDDLALIAADVFPRDLSASPRETLARLSEAVSTLAEHGLVIRYEVDDEDLLYVDRWKRQQRIDKPARGRFRRPDGTLEYSEDVDRESYASPREGVGRAPETLAPGTGEQGNRGTGEELPCASADAEREPEPRNDDAIAEFDAWYDAYPRKRGKGQAAKAYRAARKKADAQTLLDAVRRQTPTLTARGADYCPYPATWLNGQRWEDEPDGATTAPVAIDQSRFDPCPSGLTDAEYSAWWREQVEKQRRESA